MKSIDIYLVQALDNYPYSLEDTLTSLEYALSHQIEALHLTACSSYNTLANDLSLKYLALIWHKSNNRFEDEYLNDKRFKYMFANITHLIKKDGL